MKLSIKLTLLLTVLSLSLCRIATIEDPERYIEGKDYNAILESFEQIHKLKNYTSYLIVVDQMEDFNKAKKLSLNTKNIENFTEELSVHVYPSLEANRKSIFIVFLIKDRKFRIRTGGAVRSFFSDSKAKSIFMAQVSLLKKKKYGKAFVNIAQALKVYLSRSKFMNFILDNLALILFVAFLFLYFIYTMLERHLYTISEDRLKKKLEKLREMSKKYSKEKKYIQTNCVICLEEMNQKEQKELPVIPVESDLDHKLEVNDCPGLITLQCGHQFHEECINTWTDKTSHCPVCRHKLDIDDNRLVLRNIGNFQVSREPRLRDRVNLNFDSNDVLTYVFISRATHYSSNTGGSGSGGGFGGAGGFSGGW